MKIVKRYSDDFKREIVELYLTSDLTQQAIADKFGIATHSSIQQWVRKFGGEFRTPVMDTPPQKPKSDLPYTPEGMARRIQELEEALERERLTNLATNKMIDVAERDLNISIRKKSGAKQSRK
ncbi:transposase [Mucilaginibacter sp. SJ]|uniref:transposase n=1 Tax=Mucilaginibacter sp. SJ TaxID=3029053 RepID=UPI0023AA0D26|nr:transposase [Mucilaginibacter sp. SJ]WEA01738.1 transposase [Mucilaginibacter sp. SJ]